LVAVRRAFALILFVLCGTLAAAVPARAQSSPSASSTPPTSAASSNTGPKLILVDQPPWVAARQALQLQLRIQPAGTAGLTIRASLHRALNTRLGFEQTVAGEGLGGVIDTAAIPVDTAPKGPAGTFYARFGMPGSSLPSGTRLQVPESGVYPLTIELRSGTVAIDQFVTWIVYIANGTKGQAAIPEPLSVSWVWSIIASPAYEPGTMTPDPEVLSQFAKNGRLGQIGSLLGHARGVPLTLAVSPETLQSWTNLSRDHADFRAPVAAVRAAAASSANDLLPEPFIPINLPAFEAADLGDYLSTELVAGSTILHDLTGVRVDTRTAFVDPVDAASLARLRGLLFQQVLVREGELSPEQPNLTPAQPFTLSSDDTTFDAASTNPTVESWLNGTDPPALRAQRFIAGLSLIALEAPSNPRGIIVATTRDWVAEPALISTVLRDLVGNPLLQPTTLGQYFDHVPAVPAGNDDGLPAVRQLQPAPPAQPVGIDRATYEQSRASLDSFRTLVGPGDPRVVRGDRALLVAPSTDLDPTEARAELSVIDQAAANFGDRITVLQQRVTLTARHVQIPLTFRNATGQTVRVRVTLSAPSGKMLFPEGSQSVVTLAPGNQTLRFTVETRATGTFAMIVTLTSEDGQLPIGPPTQMTVRSTVFSGWGAALTIGALAFLAVWWTRDILRHRRAARRAALA
jgi:hypothetical protein